MNRFQAAPTAILSQHPSLLLAKDEDGHDLAMVSQPMMILSLCEESFLDQLSPKPQHVSSIIPAAKKTTSLATKTVDTTTTSTTTTPKTKKRVQFAPPERLATILDIDYPEDDLLDDLYYNDDDYHFMMHRMKLDVLQYELNTVGKPRVEMRGLERRTKEGHKERAEWRITVWNAVLDEQESQWESNSHFDASTDSWDMDTHAIALQSLQNTSHAKRLARTLALQDAHDVQEIWKQDAEKEEELKIMSWSPKSVQDYKLPLECDELDDDDLTEITTTNLLEASWNTSFATMMDSSISCSSISSLSVRRLSSLSELPSLTPMPTHKPNRKGHSVHFGSTLASTVKVLVYEYQHVRTDQEKQDLWYPYWSLEQAKMRYGLELDMLEQPPSRTNKRHLDDDHTCFRGLEYHTPTAQSKYEQAKASFWNVVQSQQHPSPEDSAEEEQPQQQGLAEQCESFTAKARKEARSRGLMDQRAVKVYLYQQGYHSSKGRGLIVGFAGNHMRLMLPTHSILSHLGPRYDLLLLCDADRHHFSHGIPGLGDDIGKLSEWIRSKMATWNYESFVVLGTSAGGLAAIACAYVLKCRRAVVLGADALSSHPALTTFIQDKIDQANKLNALHPMIVVGHDDLNDRDRKAAMEITTRLPRHHRRTLDGGGAHNVLQRELQNGQLQVLLSELLEHSIDNR